MNRRIHVVTARILTATRRARLSAISFAALLVFNGAMAGAQAADGDLDASFGKGGKVTTHFSLDDRVNAVAVQPDGKIVAAGAVSGAQSSDIALARYNRDGSLDSTFGDNGKTTTDSSNLYDEAFDVIIQPDGKIVAAGTHNVGLSVVRYNSDGSLDNSFGSGGRVTTDFFTGFDEARGVIIDDIGRIIAAGFTHLSTKTSFAAARYKRDGSLDLTFGDGGRVTTDIPSEATPEEFEAEAYAVAIQADGKIVAAGRRHSSVTTGNDFALVRYLSASYDVCLQDDGGGEILQFNSTTGDYRFTSCSGFTMSGTGVLDRRGANLTLRHNAGDRRLLVTVNTVVNRGTASIQALSQGLRLAITDRNIANNSCACE